MLAELAPAEVRRFPGRDTNRNATGGAALAATSSPSDSRRCSADGALPAIAAASDTVNGPLASTFALMMRTRGLGPDPALPVALGWRVLRLDRRDIHWHDVQDAPGFSEYVSLDPSRGRPSLRRHGRR